MKTYKKKPGYHYLSETEFDTILQLFRLKQTDLFIAKAVKRAHSLVSKIRRSGATSLNEFREYTKNMSEQREQAKQTPLPLEPEAHEKKSAPENINDDLLIRFDQIITIQEAFVSEMSMFHKTLQRIADALEKSNEPIIRVEEKEDEENASEEDLPIL